MADAFNTQIIFDDILTWKGHGAPHEQENNNLWDSRCRLRIISFTDDSRIAPVYRWVVVASDLGPGNGTSITNAAENIYNIICDHFGLDSKRLLWIEHYPDAGSLGEHMDCLSIQEQAGQTKPKWMPISLNILNMINPYIPEASNIIAAGNYRKTR